MNSIEKTLRVVDAFLKTEQELGIVEISKTAGINVGSAHRIVSILVKNGYLNQPRKRGKYSLGLKFIQLGSATSKRMKIINLIMPFLKEMNIKTNETVSLAVLDGDQAVYIESVASNKPLRASMEIGNRVPLYATGVGKIFLASMPSKQFEEYVSRCDFFCYTETTISSPEKLKQEILLIQQNDLAVDNEEMVKGIRCLAIPVKGINGEVIASVSISGPDSRINDSALSILKPFTKNYGRLISEKFGYHQ